MDRPQSQQQQRSDLQEEKEPRDAHTKLLERCLESRISTRHHFRGQTNGAALFFSPSSSSSPSRQSAGQRSDQQAEHGDGEWRSPLSPPPLLPPSRACAHTPNSAPFLPSHDTLSPAHATAVQRDLV
ncbi:unnamed protein product [Lampetra planeri]